MEVAIEIIDAILTKHGIRGPWAPLRATGVANRIYATQDIVLRIATDHPEGFCDARTESVAAPAAHAAGIRTPRLIAFDDSRTLVDRPFSLWERVHGETLGLLTLPPASRGDIWHQVGRELALLHARVSACPDPNGYLDDAGRELDLHDVVEDLVRSELLDNKTAQDTRRLIDELWRHVQPSVPDRFVHGDVHAMNIMCSADGDLLALIDWGDAGWGDPTIDFAAIPLDMMPHAVEGYESGGARGLLGTFPEARFTWDKLGTALRHLGECRTAAVPLDELRAFLTGMA